MDSRREAMYRQVSVFRGTISGLILYVALALKVIGGSTTTSLDSSLHPNSVAFPNCTGTTSGIGDGSCDDENNNVECGYDGGDCCVCNCVGTEYYHCISPVITCLDPEAGDPQLGCDVLPNIPPEVDPCVPGTRRHWVVETTADADSLAEGMLCSDGWFEVEWKGYVFVNRTLYVIDGTVLDVVGVGDAVADGGGRTQLFSVFNGVLRVSDLEMSNGAGIYGGAISATQQSEVTLSRADVSFNTAEGFGGGVHLYRSFLELAIGSTFTGNSAVLGGAIHVGRNSTFIQHVGSGEVYRFIDNNATDGGALYVSDSSRVAEFSPKHSTSTSTHGSYSTVRDTNAKMHFLNNTVQRSGGGVYIDLSSQWVWVGETTFEGNSAGYGGALYVGPFADVRLQGVTLFSQNSARQDGGAVVSAVYRTFLDASISLVGAASFLNNTSGGSGGALAVIGDTYLNWGDTPPQFSGNSAGLSGGAIYLSDINSGNQFDHALFTENQAQNGGAVLAAGCGTNQDWTNSEEPVFHPTIFSNCTFVGNSALDTGGASEIATGRARFYNTTFVRNIANVGGALRLFGTVELLNSSFFDNRSGEGGGSAISNTGVISEMIGLEFSANRFICTDNEYADFSEGHNMLATICHGCYQPCTGCNIEGNTSVPTCTSLFDHAQSENGTATIEGVIVDAGYWRVSNQSSNVLSCYNADACLGGLTGDPDYCRDGYEGPYCSVCCQGYTAMLANTCSKCSDRNLAVVVLVLAIALLTALAFVWHMVSIKKVDATRSGAVRVEKRLPLQSIKIVIVAWQIITQFSSVAHVIYPEAYQRLLGVVALVNFDIGWMLSAGCIVDADFHDGLLVVTVGPVAMIALLGITYVVAIDRNRGSEGGIDWVRRKHLGAAFFLTFFIYSSVSSTVFRTFACDELDDGSVYLRADYRIECDSPRHQYYMIYAAIMIIAYPVGIPLFYTIILFREHKMMVQGHHNETPRNDATSTLRKPYRPSVFYYEVVECSRRIFLTGAVVFIYPDTAAQIAVTIVIAFTFVVVSEGLNPYASMWDSWVSRAGHLVVFFSMYIALLLRVDISSERQRDQNVFAGFLIAAHAIMILLVVVETIVLLYSMRTQGTSLPVSRSSSFYPARVPPSSAEC